MKLLFAFLIAVSATPALSQDTFSIVAVDSVTGEVGSAGASCVPVSLPTAPHGVLIICDVIPGIGAINTQSYWLAANQLTAHNRMLAGDSVQAIIDWLISHDAQGNPAIRQYGVVELNGGHPRSAAFTGANCMDYKNHITGPGYSIQGNILLGQQILDSMQSRFLNATGTLSDKLMAALQGANVVGADTRCAPNGLSSFSSYLRVAKPGDTTGTYSVDLYMAYPGSSNWPVDPIDSLQTLYNNWILTGINDATGFSSRLVRAIQNENEFIFEFVEESPQRARLELFNIQGKKIFDGLFEGAAMRVSKSEINFTYGTLLYRISFDRSVITGKMGSKTIPE